MDYIQESDVLKFHPEILYVIRKKYNLHHKGAMAEAVDSLNDWIRKQNHFTNTNFDRGYLERIIISRKGSLERAKSQIDKLCTLRTLLPIFFEKTEVRYELNNVHEYGAKIFYPYLLENFSRIVMFIPHADIPDDYKVLNFFRYIFCVCEYMLCNEYADGFLIVLDFSKLNLVNVLKKTNFLELKQAITVGLEGYGVKLEGIHIITASKVVDTLITMLKQILSKKIAARIVVHNSKETLENYIPKNKLPIEYGGSEFTVKTLHDNLFNAITSKEHSEFLKKMKNFKTNESLRPKELKLNEEMLGLSGTFRSLNVD